jgi:hypothetical protein
MEIDISPFVEALKQRDLRKAKEWLEARKTETGTKNEFWAGYFLALGGMLSALESSQELSVIQKLVIGSPAKEEIEKLMREFRKQLSLKFKPKDERGFNTAWLEFLQYFASS